MRLFSLFAWFHLGLFLVLGGCCSPESDRVADRWALKGPFRAIAPEQTRRAAERERGASISPRPAPLEPDVTTNGLFALRDNHESIGNRHDPRPGSDHAESELAEGLRVDPAGSADDRFWYLDLGFRMGMMRLHETEDRLDKRMNAPARFDVFGVFESPDTPIDRKSDFDLTTAYVGIGRRETEWLAWNFYLGAGVGVDRDHQRWLNANLDVNFEYAAYFTGLTADVYPWGHSQRGRYATVREHLRASRPYLMSGFELGYIRARGFGHLDLAPIRIYSHGQRVEDWLVSWLIGLGWEVPLDECWALNLQVHYTFHFYRPDEYNGWNITYALRYQF